MEHKAVRLFPVLHTIKPFLCQNHPIIHPDTTAFTKYWEDQEVKCVEGLWGLDKIKGQSEGGYRYMPGNLYYYINICKIEDEGDVGDTVYINPELRDVEWIMAYAWLACRGFSGFEDDTEVTCNRIVKKIEEGAEMSPKELKVLKGLKIKKSDGSYKKYIEAREYLYMTHDKPLGRCIYENESLDLFLMATRGLGKSYFTSHAIIGHEFNFYGKKYYDEKYLINPSGVEIVVGAAQKSKSGDLLRKFERNQDNLKEHLAAWKDDKTFIPGYFWLPTEGTFTPGSKYVHAYEDKVKGTWLRKGSKTSISHVVYTVDNPQAAAGTRPTVMVTEEVGLLGPLLQVIGSNQSCQIRKTKFGSSIYIGTGGNMEKSVEAKIVFEDPNVYNFLPYPDLWENRSKPIGLFIPAYYADSTFKDENGNTDIEAAFAEEVYIRKRLEKANNSSAIDERMMNRPLVPSEMFLNTSGNVFPIAQLRERYNKVDVEGLFELKGTKGWFNYDALGDVTFVPDLNNKLKAIVSTNLDSYQNNYHGAVVMYEDRIDDLPPAKFTRNLYKVVYDPVQDDNGGTSLASIIVYKGYAEKSWDGGMQNTIVCDWIGRFDRVDEIHELALKMAEYYSAKLLPEINIPGIITYAKMRKKYHILQPSPLLAIGKVMQDNKVKYEVGIKMNSQLNLHSEQLLRTWLLQPFRTDEREGDLLTLDTLYSPRLLQEFIQYNRKGNFDHVSSMRLLALWLSQEEEEPIAKVESAQKYDRLNHFIKDLKRRRSKKSIYYEF